MANQRSTTETRISTTTVRRSKAQAPTTESSSRLSAFVCEDIPKHDTTLAFDLQQKRSGYLSQVVPQVGGAILPPPFSTRTKMVDTADLPHRRMSYSELHAMQLAAHTLMKGTPAVAAAEAVKRRLEEAFEHHDPSQMQTLAKGFVDCDYDSTGFEPPVPASKRPENERIVATRTMMMSSCVEVLKAAGLCTPEDIQDTLVAISAREGYDRIRGVAAHVAKRIDGFERDRVLKRLDLSAGSYVAMLTLFEGLKKVDKCMSPAAPIPTVQQALSIPKMKVIFTAFEPWLVAGQAEEVLIPLAILCEKGCTAEAVTLFSIDLLDAAVTLVSMW